MCKSIVVVAPHFDDLELGCGGYVAHLLAQGHEVHLLVTCCSPVTMETTGDTQPYERVEEANRASKVLGGLTTITRFSEGVENNLHLGDYSALVGFLNHNLKHLKPSTLLIPLPSFNQDHRATYEAVLTALRPTVDLGDMKVLAYEYPMSNGYHPTGRVCGESYFPLTEVLLSQKKSALLKHKSQVFGREYTITGIRGVEALAAMRGVECGVKYAEKFYVVREVLS